MSSRIASKAAARAVAKQLSTRPNRPTHRKKVHRAAAVVARAAPSAPRSVPVTLDQKVRERHFFLRRRMALVVDARSARHCNSIGHRFFLVPRSGASFNHYLPAFVIPILTSLQLGYCPRARQGYLRQEALRGNTRGAPRCHQPLPRSRTERVCHY